MLEELRHVTPRAPRHRRSSRASPMSLVSGRNSTGKGRGHTRTPLRQRCPGMLCRTSTDAPQKSAPRKCSFWTASSISMGGKQVPPSMTYKPIERNSHRTGGYMMLCNEPLKKLPKGIQAALRGHLGQQTALLRGGRTWH